jgi:hypothetical protein
MASHIERQKFLATLGGAPVALAARDEDSLALFIGEPIERLWRSRRPYFNIGRMK